MIYREIIVHTTSEASEIIQGLFLSADITLYTVEDPEDFKDLLENKFVPFDYIDDSLMSRAEGETLIKAYIEEGKQGDDRISSLKKLISEFKDNSFVDAGSLEIEINTLDDEDWANNWKQYFHPIVIGEKFVVKPTWEEYEPDGRYIIDIDPESSFGTGQHETTALCLEAVEKVDVEGKDILDMGCGSGILGIGAAMLGAKSVTAVDIEENSARIATENAKKNHVFSDAFKIYWGNVLDGGEFKEKILPEKKIYDVVLINIVADIVCEMLPMISKSLEGKIVCSGIISERKEKVLNSLSDNGFTVIEVMEKNDWVCVVADNKK